MPNIKMIVSDMDGTLLSSQKTISDTNLKTINQLQDKDIVFAIATGRMYPGLSEFLPLFQTKVAVVALNGGLVYDEDGKLIEDHPFAPDQLSTLVKLLVKENVYFELIDENSLYSNSEENCIRLIKMVLPNIKTTEQARQTPIYARTKFINNEQLSKQQPIYKIRAFNFGETDLAALKKIIESTLECEITSSDSSNIEINPKGISKGKGIHFLSNYYKIDKSQIMALGDNLNDLSMIGEAGIFCAMANAHPLIIEKSDIQTDTNDNDGVAKAIVSVTI